MVTRMWGWNVLIHDEILNVTKRKWKSKLSACDHGLWIIRFGTQFKPFSFYNLLFLYSILKHCENSSFSHFVLSKRANWNKIKKTLHVCFQSQQRFDGLSPISPLNNCQSENKQSFCTSIHLSFMTFKAIQDQERTFTWSHYRSLFYEIKKTAPWLSFERKRASLVWCKHLGICFNKSHILLKTKYWHLKSKSWK